MGLNRRQEAAAALMLLGFSVVGVSPCPGRALNDPPPVSIEEVRRYALPFVSRQRADGSYNLSPRVQAHEKAEIAMALAAEATQTPSYAQSAWRDLQWVMANRLEPSGGLNWYGPDSQYFFECHQHWFLISSELIRRQIGVPDSMRVVQQAVWRFLTGRSPAATDFYLRNQQMNGPFFAYRSVNRNGDFQTQAPFKGSYEIGTALWSFSMIRDLPWMQGGKGSAPSDGLTLSDYLFYSARQAAQPADAMGWFDPGSGRWVRALLWGQKGWMDWQAPDWKYALNMQEGALLYKIMTGATNLDPMIRGETNAILALVRPDGTIATLPDPYGSPQQEYGDAMSVLALAAQAFSREDPAFAATCYHAGLSVANHVIRTLLPESSEDGSLMLRGIARIYQTQTALRAVVAGMADLETGGTRSGGTENRAEPDVGANDGEPLASWTDREGPCRSAMWRDAGSVRSRSRRRAHGRGATFGSGAAIARGDCRRTSIDWRRIERRANRAATS